MLAALPKVDGNPYVIVGGRAGRHLVNIKYPWQAIRVAAGLEDLRLHDLRHSFASVAAAGGLSLPVLGALLGHKSSATTARYVHLFDDPLKAAVNQIGLDIAGALK